jgi:PAS domain S-box-containing protein
MKTKFIFAVTSIILIIAVIILYNLHLSSKKEVIRRFKTEQVLGARRLASNIESYLHNRTDEINSLSLFPSLQNRDMKMMVSDVQTYWGFEKNNHVKAVSVYDENGTIIYSTTKEAIGRNYKNLDFFQWAAKKENKGKQFISSLIQKTYDIKAPLPYFRFLLVAPVYQKIAGAHQVEQQDKFVGIVTSTIDLKEIVSDFLPLVTDSTYQERAFILDRNGTLLLHSKNPEMVLKNFHLQEKTCFKCHISFNQYQTILSGKEGTTEYSLVDMPKELASFSPMDFNNISWKIVISIPYEKITGFITINLYMTLVLIGAIALTLIGGSLLIYRSTRLKIRAEEETKQSMEKLGLQDRIRESESLYYSFIEQLPNAVFRKDRENHYILVNSQFCRLKGLKKEDLIGKTPKEVADSEILNQGEQRHALNYANLGEEIHNLILQTGKFYEKEEEYPDIKGGIKYMHVLRMPVFDSAGTIIGTQGIMFDITARKQIENILRKGEVDLNEAQRLGQIGSWECDATNSTITRSKEYFRVYDMDPDISTNIFQEHLKTYTPGSTALLDSAFKKCLQTGEGYQLDLEKINADGTSRWITERGESKRDDKGKIVGVRGTAQDITERKRAELEITMLAQSLKSINECVSITDKDDNILFVNESFLKTYGFNENELVGKNMSIVRSRNNSPELVKDILPATLSGKWKGEVLNKRKDGTEFPISLSTTTVYDKNGTRLGLIGVASDITERKRAENELINAKDQAESASKLKDAFIANISHEIRTPLNGILGMTALIKDIYHSNVKKEDEVLFEGIDISSNRIIRTIDMILNYSRLHVGEFSIKPDKINISMICANLAKEFNSAAKNKSLDLSFQNNCGDTAIFADQYSINMAVSNLIDNAIKFTNKGSVNVILHKEKNDDLILDVKDTGIGIDKEYLNHIFEPYRQEDMRYGRAYDGIGLGLAIVKKILDLNKCSINVESEKGEGTTFSINLGKGEQPLKNKIEDGVTANILPVLEEIRKEAVLLVEDDLMNQVTIRRFIEKKYRVIITASSDEAMEIIKKEKIDIILMDISIKGSMNGLELTKELKASDKFSHIPIMAVTAHAFLSDRKNSLDAGCDDYLAKPFTLNQLLIKIDKLVQSSYS